MRYAAPGLCLIAFSVLAGSLVYSDAGQASVQTLALARSLIWPAVLIAGILLFRPHVEIVLAALAASMSRVANVKVAGLTIKMDPNRIPEPKGTNSVTLSNMALLHTSFLRPDKTAAFADGSTYYQVEIVVAAPAATLRRVTSVTYFLDETYVENVRTVSDRGTRFKLKELANGAYIARAEVSLEGQTELLHLNRFIDLRPDGPRI